MKRTIFISFIILIGLSSFRSKPVKKILDEFTAWYKENGTSLVTNRSKATIDYQLTYIPNEFSIIEEIKDREKITSKELKELSLQYQGIEEYTLKISTAGVRDFLLSQSIDKQDYNDKLYYLIGNISSDFRMVNDQDSLTPLRCDFENNYGTAPFITLRLVFDKPKTNKELTNKKIIFNDVLFSNDTIQYNLSHLIKLTIPQL